MWDLGRNSVTSWSMSLTNMFGGSSSKARQNARERERGGPYCWQLILLIIHPMTAHYIIIWITSPFDSGPHLSQASLLQKREQLKVLRLEVRRGQLSRGALGRGRDSEIEIFCGGLVDWLVVSLCPFFCFLMLCNVFHPTSDDYLNSLIDTHSHVCIYIYICISFHVYISI